MSDAERAYEAAVEEIARVRAEGGLSAMTLDLRLRRTRDLKVVPSEIESLPDLQVLYLSDTRVSDLTPLVGLKKLRRLHLENSDVRDLEPLSKASALLEHISLNGTSIEDLSPVRAMRRLRSLFIQNTKVRDLRPILDLPEFGDGGSAGLHFPNTPAAESHPELKKLALTIDQRDRNDGVIEFLKTLPPWPEPLPWEIEKLEKRAATDTPAPPPEQDPSLPLIWGPQGFDFMAAHMDLDPLTAEALAELRDLLDALIRQSGNSHEDLHRLATEMRERCELQDGKLNALRLHMSFQKLERLHAGRERRERRLDDEIVTTLEGILLTAPGATLGDPQVATLIARQDANRATPAAPIDTARAEAVLDAVTEPDAPFDDEVKETAETAIAPGPDDRITATRGILARNVVVAVGRRLLLVVGAVSAGVASNLLTPWVVAHAKTLQAYALTLGSDVAIWFTRVLQELGRIAPPL